MQLNKPSLVLTSNCVDAHVQTESTPIPEARASPIISCTNTYVQTDATPEMEVFHSSNVNGIQSHVVKEDDLVLKVVNTQLTLPAEPAVVNSISPSTEYADDIALLTDPNVLRESELITVKEQCSKLTDENRQLTLRLSKVASGGDAVQINSATLWIFTVLILIIACLLAILWL